MSYQAIAVGSSAGGLRALTRILRELPSSLSVPLLVVQHVGRAGTGRSAKLLDERSSLRVKLAEDKEPIAVGTVYVAPPDYHLLVEPDRTLALSVDEPVHHCRPSVDVLFESAADAYGSGLVGVVLTGANRDGAAGLRAIKQRGGYAIVEDPATAEARAMPAAAIDATDVDRVLPVDYIGELLCRIVGRRSSSQPRSGGRHG